MMDRVTDNVAGLAITSPLWLSSVHDVFVTWIVPLLGASWLIVQMYYKIKNERNKPKND